MSAMHPVVELMRNCSPPKPDPLDPVPGAPLTPKEEAAWRKWWQTRINAAEMQYAPFELITAVAAEMDLTAEVRESMAPDDMYAAQLRGWAQRLRAADALPKPIPMAVYKPSDAS